MPHELFVLRHAKSDWGEDFRADKSRRLSKRGTDDASAMGRWIKHNGLNPDLILSSSASRAQLTAELVSEELAYATDRIVFLDQLYLASLETLLTTINELNEELKSVMLIGHNPGLDDLVNWLSSDSVPLTSNGKLMTTTCLAHFKINNSWSLGTQQHQAELVSITRPADIH